MTDPRINIQITGSEDGVRRIISQIRKDVQGLTSDLKALQRAEVDQAKVSVALAKAEAQKSKALAQSTVAQERARKASVSTAVVEERLAQAKQKTIVAEQRANVAKQKTVIENNRVLESEQRVIRATASKISAQNRVVASEEAVETAIQRRIRATQQAILATIRANRATDDAVAGNSRLNASVTKSESVFTGAIASYVKFRIAVDAVSNAIRLLVRGFDFAQSGAEIRQVATSFNNLNESVFEIPDLLDRLRASAKGTVSDLSLQRSVLQLTAGVSDDLAKSLANATPELLEIARSASILNPALGDTQTFFDRLSLGIKRSSSRIIDDLGIIVKIGEANTRFADSIGKTVSELTAEEKQLALLNEVLRAGSNLIGQVGEETENAVDPFFQLRTAVEELTNSLKELASVVIEPIIIPVTKVVTDINEGINALSDDLGGVESGLDGLGRQAVEAGDVSGTIGRIVAQRDFTAGDLFTEVTGLENPLQAPLTALAVNLFSLGSDLDEQLDSALADVLATGASERATRRITDAETGEVGFEFDPEFGARRVLLEASEEAGRELIPEFITTGTDFSTSGEQEIISSLLSTSENQLGELIVEINREALRELTARRRVDSPPLGAEGIGTTPIDEEAFDAETNRNIRRTAEAVSVLTEEEEALAEAQRDLAIGVVKTVGEVSDLSEILLEAGDSADLSEDEIIALAKATGVLDEESAEVALSLIELTKRAEELAPAIANGNQQAIAEFAKIQEQVKALSEDVEDAQASAFSQSALRASQSFAREQLSLLEQRAELESELAEVSVRQVGTISKEEALARQRAKLETDLTNEIKSDLEERLENEEISAEERLEIESVLFDDLTDQQRRQTLKRIAEIQLGAEIIPVFTGDASRVKEIQEEIDQINEALANNFRESVFEASISAKGLTQETLELGIALGVVDESIREEAESAIALATAFTELVDLFDSRGIDSVSTQAEAFELLASGQASSAQEAINRAVAEEGNRRRIRQVSRQAKRDLARAEGLAEPVFDDDDPATGEEDVEEIIFKTNEEEVAEELNRIVDLIDQVVEQQRTIVLDVELGDIPDTGSSGSGSSIGGGVRQLQTGGRGVSEPFIAGEVRPELIVPSGSVDVIPRVPTGFANALSQATSSSIATPPQITNTTNISRESSVDSRSVSIENVNVGGVDGSGGDFQELGSVFIG